MTQWKDSYDDWISAFDDAVRKRATKDCFIGLSSGYDSGGIACALLKLGVEFKAYVYSRDENVEVLGARRRLVPHEEFRPDLALLKWLEAHIDNEPNTIVNDSRSRKV